MENNNKLNFSLLALRVCLGVIFVAHGAQKLFGMFDGIGLEGTTKMVEGLGFAYPYILAVIWASIEFIGGVFLILGIIVKWSASLVALTVIVIFWKVNLPYGFFIQNGGIEYNLLVIGGCLPLIFLGGGSWSVWDT